MKSMSIFRADGKQNYKIELFIPENRALWPCPAIWLHTFPGEGERIWSRLKNPCALICISGIHWNDDLSPWPAPAVMEKGGAFGGGAPAYLEYLTKTIIPRAEAALPFAPVQRGLTGYSMAGLFAVYAMYHASCFDFIGTMSGSLWFDGWLEYARTHRPVSPVKRMYVSLGSREHRVRNERMARVQFCTQELVKLWKKTMSVRYEQNAGGHFSDPEGRTARGVEWLTATNQRRNNHGKIDDISDQ